jgi:hypothetical protein
MKKEFNSSNVINGNGIPYTMIKRNYIKPFSGLNQKEKELYVELNL